MMTASNTHGWLRLHFDFDATQQRTILRTCEQQTPLRVVRAFPIADGGALVHLHNLSGGVLGGDCLELEVETGPQTYVQLTSTGATRLYRSRGAEATQFNRIKIGPAALLEYVPDQLIPFAGSRYLQETQIELAAGAGLFWWEITAPGREAYNEAWAYDWLQSSLAIRSPDSWLALERFRLEPALATLGGLAQLSDYKYFASFYICRLGLPPTTWRNLETELSTHAQTLTQLGQNMWGVSTLARDGLVVRGLSQHSREILTGLPLFWQIAKRALYNQTAVLPRKIY